MNEAIADMGALYTVTKRKPEKELVQNIVVTSFSSPSTAL